MPPCFGVLGMGSLMDERVGSSENIEVGEVRKCRVHGLLFDADIAEICPMCEFERTDRIANGS